MSKTAFPAPAGHHTLYGRRFAILARFSGVGYVDRANAYMTQHSNAGLLADIDGEAILADMSDKGEPVRRPVES
jgi:hypothetical protein